MPPPTTCCLLSARWAAVTLRRLTSFALLCTTKCARVTNWLLWFLSLDATCGTLQVGTSLTVLLIAFGFYRRHRRDLPRCLHLLNRHNATLVLLVVPVRSFVFARL